jgi:endonuclease III
MDDLVKDLVEITFEKEDDFLKIRETLSRIGVASRKTKELFQSCHILHKRGKYYIVHFKELFKLDGKPTNLDESDIGRRNTIVSLLEQWNLVKVVDKSMIEEPRTPLSQIKIIPYKEKSEWTLTAKYSIGVKQ